MRPLDVVVVPSVVTTRAPSSVDGARESVVAVDSLVVVVVVVDAVRPPPPGMYTAHHARASPPLTTPRTSHVARARHPSMDPSIHPSIHPAIDRSIHRYRYRSIDRRAGVPAQGRTPPLIDPCGPRREALDDRSAPQICATDGESRLCAVVCTHRYTHVVGGPRQTNKPARARRGRPSSQRPP